MEDSKNRGKIVFISIGEALADFKRKGYNLEFMRDPACLYCRELNLWITPKEFSVDISYYLEELSNPDEDRVFYGISSSTGLKGVLLEACGVYSDTVSPEMSSRLSMINYRAFQKMVIKKDESKELGISS